MKVSELIAELQKRPLDAEVITEGCDCFGDTYSVGGDERTVVIHREPPKPSEPIEIPDSDSIIEDAVKG